MLAALQRLPVGAVVDPFLAIAVGDWLTDEGAVLARIRDADVGSRLAIRSSAWEEDATTGPAPGTYLSVLDVDARSEAAITQAIREVIASYEQRLAPQDLLRSEVIVQAFLEECVMAAVVESTGGDQSSAYVIVDYAYGPRTDAVTSGGGQGRAFVVPGHSVGSPWETLTDLAQLCEEQFGYRVTLEVSIDKSGVVHVFQCRVGRVAEEDPSDAAGVRACLETISADLSEGPRTGLWSDMADWNPAEMLGPRAAPLDVSLYESLIGRRSWWQARCDLGYRAPQEERLFRRVGEVPYVAVHLSIESFLPRDLPNDLAHGVVQNRVSALSSSPHLHDKLESSITVTCAVPPSDPRIESLLATGIPPRDVTHLRESLARLTTSLIQQHRVATQVDQDLGASLAAWSRGHPLSDLAPLAFLDWLTAAMDRCEQMGVRPFARQARKAFIGQDVATWLQRAGALPQDWYNDILRTTDTVTTDLTRSVSALAAGEQDEEEFRSHWGHLRARMYDITSPRFRDLRLPRLSPSRPPPTSVHREPIRVPAAALRDGGIEVSWHEVDFLVRSAVIEREHLKYRFSEVLSAILEGIAAFGATLDLAREDLRFLEIDELVALCKTWPVTQDLKAAMRDTAEARRAEWQVASAVMLPPLIRPCDDLHLSVFPSARPNVVGTEEITGPVVELRPPYPPPPDTLAGRIVAIDAADPGFDWLFAYDIRGLVTMYGGPGSHMAVRCAQLDLPAALGCGQSLFRRIVDTGWVTIDGPRGEVRVQPG
jgi:hypothetical protein